MLLTFLGTCEALKTLVNFEGVDRNACFKHHNHTIDIRALLSK